MEKIKETNALVVEKNLELFHELSVPARKSDLLTDNSSTFVNNMSIPVHRWFRYSAGFSAEWVKSLIEQEVRNGRSRVLDPFAGSGTVLLESEGCNVRAIGIESHPFVARVTRAKLHWRERPASFREHALSVLERAKKIKTHDYKHSKLIEKCFSTAFLSRLYSLRKAWEENADGSPLSELTWLTLTSILRECSFVGTAQWQYVLPKKSKAKVKEPYKAFELRTYIMSSDMEMCQKNVGEHAASLYQEDARYCSSVPNGWADLIITSPPYANNYDYADATRFEMSFFGEINGWGDLQQAVRKHLIRSCTQHVAEINGKTYDLVADPLLEPIREELMQACKQLEAEREKHGGRKPYHTMIAAYFSDMAKVWAALRRVTSTDSLICFIIGDSAPYGIHIPVDKWFGELALSVGFKSYTFEKTRDRNVKWKNRKHRVPLHEGRLWVRG